MSDPTDDRRSYAGLALLLLTAAFVGGLVLAWLFPPAATPAAARTQEPSAANETPHPGLPVAAARPDEPPPASDQRTAGRLTRLEQAVVALTARLAAPPAPDPELAALQERLARLEAAMAKQQPATETPVPPADPAVPRDGSPAAE